MRQPLTLSQSMLFGSLIASTDPIATLSILKAVNAPPLLFDLIFGESALNDALSIVLFNVFRELCEKETAAMPKRIRPPASPPSHHHHKPHHPHPPYPPASPMLPPSAPPEGAASTIGSVVLDLLVTVVGSVGIGIFLGLSSAYLTKRLRMQSRGRPEIELVLLLTLAMGAYTASEAVECSGILALFVASVIMQHYTYYNLSVAAQETSKLLFKSLATASEAALSLLVGVAIVDYAYCQSFCRTFWDPPFALAIVPILIIARGANILPLSTLANTCRPRGGHAPRITGRMQAVMWLSGLRGAVSFALAMTLDDDRTGVVPIDVATQIVSTALVVIVATNLFLAPLMGPLIRHLRLNSSTAPTTALAINEATTAAIPTTPIAAQRTNTRAATSRSAAGRAGEGVGMLHNNCSSGSSATERLLPSAALAEGSWTAGAEDVSTEASTGSRREALFASPPTDGAPHTPTPMSHGGPASALVSADGGASEPEPQLADADGGNGSSEMHSEMTPGAHRLWRRIDEGYLKPAFGGRQLSKPKANR